MNERTKENDFVFAGTNVETGLAVCLSLSLSLLPSASNHHDDSQGMQDVIIHV